MFQKSETKKLMVILEQFDQSAIQKAVKQMAIPFCESNDENPLVKFTPELGSVYTLARKCEDKLYRFGFVRGFGVTKAKARAYMEGQGETKDKAFSPNCRKGRICDSGQCVYDSGIVEIGCDELEIETKGGRKLKFWACTGFHAGGCFCAV